MLFRIIVIYMVIYRIDDCFPREYKLLIQGLECYIRRCALLFRHVSSLLLRRKRLVYVIYLRSAGMRTSASAAGVTDGNVDT